MDQVCVLITGAKLKSNSYMHISVAINEDLTMDNDVVVAFLEKSG